MNCATCKHWEEAEWYNPRNKEGFERFKECALANGSNGRGETREEMANRLFWAADPDSGYGELMTRDDFGCVLHEPITR
jgi:hypothetical protein